MVLAGLGLAVPEHAIAQEDAATIGLSFASADGSRARTLQALYKRTGVKKRHSVVLESAHGPVRERQSFYPPIGGADDPGPSTGARMLAFERHAPPLAEEASRRALLDATLDAEEITHLVTVSCTGFFSPGLDAALIDRLGLRRTVQRTHVGFMGCHGALNGLRVAASFVEADPAARVLLCAVELCTLHLAYGWDPERLVANALFADGAAAAVGVPAGARLAPAGRTPADASVDAPVDAPADEGPGGGPRGWRVAASGTLLLPDSRDAMSWRIGDGGFRMTLGAEVPDVIQAHVAGWLGAWLDEQGVAMEDVESWAVHPGGPRVLTAFGQAAGLEKEAMWASREVLAEYGNMSSATILFILERMRAAGARGPCVAVAFGPGLVAEVALLV
jgi:predicted naringenin-chalcone synthase